MHARTYYIIQSPIRRVSMQALGVKPGGEWECRGAGDQRWVKPGDWELGDQVTELCSVSFQYKLDV